MIVKAYLSHHIRGPKGDDSTLEERISNRQEAVRVAQILRRYCPNLDLYVPGENDDWAELGLQAEILTGDLVLDVDCAIINTKDAVLFYDQYGQFGGGMKREEEHSIQINKPRFIFHDVSDATMKRLQEFLRAIHE